MLKLMERPRALEAQIIDGAGFPSEIFIPPFSAPVFRVAIESRLKFGPTFIIFNNSYIGDVLLAHSSIVLDIQQCHSYSQQTVLFSKGTVMSFANESPNIGAIIVTAYTYYWEV